MTTTLIRVPIVSFRRIENPFEREGKRMYIAVLQAKNLPSELDQWKEINPRQALTTSGVAVKIRKSLQDAPRSFFFKNRGVTLLVDRVSFDNELNELSLEFSDQTCHGMLDGGHSYQVIRETLEDSEDADLEDAYLKLEILEGFSDPGEVVDIVEARNTSTQVKDQSIEELKKHFEAIKQVLKNESYADRIAYKEIELAEDESRKDIDIKEILSYLICFDIEAFGDGKRHPIMAYNSKGAVLKHFKENRDRLEKYLPLLPQILQLRDTIYDEMPKTYNDATEGGRFGKLTGVIELHSKKRRSPVELVFLQKESSYAIPSAFVYPILASLRNLVICENGVCSWKKKPVDAFETMKEELVLRVGEQAKEFRNPNKLGKDNATWGRCYDYVALEVALNLK